IGHAPVKKWPEGAQKISPIARVEVATGKVQVVKDLPSTMEFYGMSLSPNGKHIAYELRTPPGLPGTPTQNRIHIVSIDGATDRPLTDHPAKYRAPHWTLDGRHLLFVSDRSGEDAVWIAAMKEGVPSEPRLVRGGFQGTTLLGFA